MSTYVFTVADGYKPSDVYQVGVIHAPDPVDALAKLRVWFAEPGNGFITEESEDEVERFWQSALDQTGDISITLHEHVVVLL